MQDLRLFSFLDVPIIGQVRAQQDGADHQCLSHPACVQQLSLTSAGCTGLHALQVRDPGQLAVLMPGTLAAVWPADAQEGCTAEQHFLGHSARVQSPLRSSSLIYLTSLGTRCLLKPPHCSPAGYQCLVLIVVLPMQIAFSSISTALRLYCEDRKSGAAVVHHGQIQKQPGSAPGGSTPQVVSK